jgi:hypothetical protein
MNRNIKKANNQFFVPHNVLEEDKFLNMPLSAQILYIHLCRLKNRLKSDPFFRDLKTLSKETNLHINTLKKAKKELIQNLYIKVKKDYFDGTGYRRADKFVLNGYRFCSHVQKTDT